MRFLRLGRYAIPVWLIVVLMLSTIGVAVIAYVLSPSFNLTLEVNEPLSIVDHPSQFSLFPGKTVDFNVTVMNSASLNYSVVLDFSVNDSEYQASYLRFSNQVYNVTPGQQILKAWMSVSSDAPVATVTMSVSLMRLGVTVTETSLNGLVGYWKFDEGSGAIAYDSSGNGNNGVLIGSPLWTAGKSGTALFFEGNSFVDCGNAASLHVQSYTLAAWINPSALGWRSTSDLYEPRILSNGAYGYPRVDGAVDFLIDVNGSLVVINQDGLDQDICRSNLGSLFTVGTWSYVAATYDATQRTVHLYVNGVELPTTVYTESGTSISNSTMRIPNPNPTYDVHIGATGGLSHNYFKGIIDEVQIYDRALTPAEITSLFNSVR